jgi:hypothetical protein
MATPGHEIERERWGHYFDSLDPELFNSEASVEVVDPSGHRRVEAAGLALQTLTYDRRDDIFEVACAHGAPHLPSVVRHVVEHPTRIEVDSPGTLAPSKIVVDDDRGARTLITITRRGDFGG